MITLSIYRSSNGHRYYTEWLESLLEVVQADVLSYVRRLELGNFGNLKNLRR
jgi:putative component of toxin-antitoxin plasmid stabilization module